MLFLFILEMLIYMRKDERVWDVIDVDYFVLIIFVFFMGNIWVRVFKLRDVWILFCGEYVLWYINIWKWCSGKIVIYDFLWVFISN